MSNMQASGFSLTETLVVIFIVAVIIGLAIPGVKNINVAADKRKKADAAVHPLEIWKKAVRIASVNLVDENFVSIIEPGTEGQGTREFFAFPKEESVFLSGKHWGTNTATLVMIRKKGHLSPGDEADLFLVYDSIEGSMRIEARPVSTFIGPPDAGP